jgi:hypothetical protein
MRNRYIAKNWLFIPVLFLLLAIAACKKDNKNTTPIKAVIPIATPTTLGLYEGVYDDSIQSKVMVIPISQVGTQTIPDGGYGLVFDTGSGGMVLDAQGILPASMITSNGFNFSTDSITVNGVTITNQTTMLEYGADDNTITKVYGNLAFAAVTIGDQNGSIFVKRLPFFIYYKAIDENGNVIAAHDFDTFGVSYEYIAFPDNEFATSPFSYFDPGNGLTRGFKLAAVGASNFSSNFNYYPGAVTLGLTSDDLSSSSGFVMNTMRFQAGAGYDPLIPSTVTYNNNTFSTDVLFDTGTSEFSFLEDPAWPNGTTQLALNSNVSLASTSGFNYSYTISAIDNLTYVENPNTSGGEFTDISIEFFLTNEYLLDFPDHKLGLKNN